MVKPHPAAPAKVIGGEAKVWRSQSPASAGDPMAQAWVRVFHQDRRCPDPDFRRTYGPLHRFDHHTGVHSRPQICPDGRSIIYLARCLDTALGEVFGDETTATICPNYRVAMLQVSADCRLQDLTGDRAAAIGALPALSTGDVPRQLSQEWARAIHRDEPAGQPIDGIYYHSAHDEGPCLALFERSPGLDEITNDRCSPGGLPLLDVSDLLITILSRRLIGFRRIEAEDCPKCKSGG